MIIFRGNTFAEDPQKQLFDLLADVTSLALSAKENSSQEKEKVTYLINEIINKLPDDNPEIQGFKSYFQMLMAFLNGDDYHPYMEKVPGELKGMFEKILEQKKDSESVGEGT